MEATVRKVRASTNISWVPTVAFFAHSTCTTDDLRTRSAQPHLARARRQSKLLPLLNYNANVLMIHGRSKHLCTQVTSKQ